MTRDLLARGLAVTAIVLALCFGLLTDRCGCLPESASRRSNLIGRLARWVTWLSVKDEFEQEPPVPVQDIGALRLENALPARVAGPDGVAELDHGHGW